MIAKFRENSTEVPGYLDSEFFYASCWSSDPVLDLPRACRFMQVSSYCFLKVFVWKSPDTCLQKEIYSKTVACYFIKLSYSQEIRISF